MLCVGQALGTQIQVHQTTPNKQEIITRTTIIKFHLLQSMKCHISLTHSFFVTTFTVQMTIKDKEQQNFEIVARLDHLK